MSEASGTIGNPHKRGRPAKPKPEPVLTANGKKRGRPAKGEPPRPPRTKGYKKTAKGEPRGYAAGKPEHVPTENSRERVKMMAACGFTLEDIGNVLDLNRETVTKHYPKELKTAHIEANGRVFARIYRDAISKDPKTQSSAFFWAKARGGWRETDRPENPGAVSVVTNVNVAPQAIENLSTAELKLLVLLYRKMGLRLPQEPPQVIDQAGRIFDAENEE